MEEKERIPMVTELVDVDQSLIDMLREAMAKRKQAYDFEKAAAILKEQANQDIEAVLVAIGKNSVMGDTGETVTLVKATPRSRFDKQKMQYSLLNSGVQPRVIKAAMDEATTKGSPSEKEYSVRYNPGEKENGCL